MTPIGKREAGGWSKVRQAKSLRTACPLIHGFYSRERDFAGWRGIGRAAVQGVARSVSARAEEARKGGWQRREGGQTFREVVEPRPYPLARLCSAGGAGWAE